MPESLRTRHCGRGCAWTITGGDAGGILGKPTKDKKPQLPPGPAKLGKREARRAARGEVRRAHHVDLVLVEPGWWQATCRCGWTARVPARKGKSAEVGAHLQEMAQQQQKQKKGEAPMTHRQATGPTPGVRTMAAEVEAAHAAGYILEVPE